MKQVKKNTLAGVIILCLMAIAFSGCYETHYYHHYHHHTREWYEHRHTPPPDGVNFDIDIRN